MATLKSTSTGNVKVVRICGRLTCEGVDEIAEGFAAETNGSSRLVVDLTDVDMIATPGIAMLITADRTVKKAGGKMVITGTCKFVQELIHRCKLDTIWTIVPDPAEALRQAQQACRDLTTEAQRK